MAEPSLNSSSCPTPPSCNVNLENGIAQSTIMDHPRITLAPDVLAGKPVIRGTRLYVEFVIGLMADGWSEADILENYPSITHEDILACLALCSRYTELGESVSERGLFLRFLANENFPAAAVASWRQLGTMSCGSESLRQPCPTHGRTLGRVGHQSAHGAAVRQGSEGALVAFRGT